MPKLIRDLSDTSSYWAAVWTICAMPDVHVICDAPIGCFNLVATAVPDYTDAIPHIENITPSVITEDEVGGSGTGAAVTRTWEGLRDTGALDGKQLIVVSTAESEMIGSDLSDLVTRLQPGTTFFHSDSLAEDEWVGRDRVLAWLWDNYGAERAADISAEPGTVNIIGPTYGCFNSVADLHEVKRLITGAGGKLNLVYPFETTLAQTPELARGAVNVLMYKEFGQALAGRLGKPVVQAPMGIQETTAFVREIGRLCGTSEQAEAFIAHEKATTLQAIWDLWKGPQGDWFGTTNIGIVATQTYVDGLSAFLGNELGMPIDFVSARPVKRDGLDNEAVRQKLHERAPAFVFGSINEKIYLSEANAKFTQFIPAAFPGPIVRRAVGTPFMGYRGSVYVLQELVNRLYEVLFNFLPVDAAYSMGAAAAATPPPAAQDGNLPWDPEASALLEATLDKLPFLPRISASRQIQMEAEALATERGVTTVTTDLVDEIVAARMRQAGR